VSEATGLCLAVDLGNTNAAFTALDREGEFVARVEARNGDESADQVGAFLLAAFASRSIGPAAFSDAAICSVTPRATRRIADALERYFGLEPFILAHDSATGIVNRYQDPAQLGLDRIAAAIGARARFPLKNLVVVDSGTAVTVDAVSATGEFLGGAILPGFEAMARALASGTARLPYVEPGRPDRALGRTSAECLRSGLYHGLRGAIRELVGRVAAEAFGDAKPFSVVTGGASEALADLFDARASRLVAEGTRLAMLMTRSRG
jgi:type III pantothenate kinase